ncbi:hypothetical protein ACHAXN_006070, partial [Cyclotella atomus]
EEEDPWSSIGVVVGAIVLGVAGVAASTAAMVTSAGMAVVYMAGGICVATSATVVRNQYELSKGKGYREGINSLRKEANRLGEQTELLVQAVNELEAEAGLMQGLEEQLSEIARKQGVNVNEIVMLVRENEEILSKQKSNLKQTFVSDMARAFISSEFLLGDMKVDLKNLPVLLLRLQIQLNSHGMRLDTEKFTEMVRRDNDVGTILKMCGDMLSVNDKGSIDPDTMDMVTLDQQYSKGSVEAARGKAPQLMEAKLDHRNTVVRDVSRRLSMRGIEIGSDSDESSVDSTYSDDQPPASARAAESHKPRRQQRQHQQQQQQVESRPKAVGKFKAAAKLNRFMGGSKRDEESEYIQDARSNPRSQTQSKFKSAAIMAAAAASPRESRMGGRRLSDNDEQSIGSSGTGSKRTTRSVDKAMNALRKSRPGGGTSSASYNRRQSDDEQSMGSTGAGSRRKTGKPVSSGKRGDVDDDFSGSGTGAQRRTRSVDKATNALKMSKSSGGTPSASSATRKSSSQPRRVVPGRGGMSPSRRADDDASHSSSVGARRARKLNSSISAPTRSASGGSSGKLRRAATMGEGARSEATRSASGGSSGRLRRAATIGEGTRREASSAGGRRRVRDRSFE